MNTTIKSMLIVVTMLAINNEAIAQKAGYHVLKTFHIASDGGWDYIAVSPVTDNIYVSHAYTGKYT